MIKKIIPAALAATMTYSLTAYANTYIDTRESSFEEAAMLTSALSIMEPLSDERFGAESEISRLEFVEMVCKACGYGQMSSSQSYFNDVNNGYVNFACESG